MLSRAVPYVHLVELYIRIETLFNIITHIYSVRATKSTGYCFKHMKQAQ